MAGDRRYHHGDLRRALLEAGLALASERGPEGFSLRETARRAGVSHAAPYHHFADRDALLQALAEESFAALDAVLADAVARAGGDPVSRVEAMLLAYLRFAVEHEQRFRLMWRHDPGRPTDERARASRIEDQPTFGRLAALLVEAERAGVLAPWPGDGDGARRATMLWAGVHGVAELLLAGQLGPLDPPQALADYRRLVWAGLEPRE